MEELKIFSAIRKFKIFFDIGEFKRVDGWGLMKGEISLPKARMGKKVSIFNET